jgi:acyl carrier protein
MGCVVETEVVKLMSSLMGVEVTVGTCREDSDVWDSMKHVELIFVIEDEFGIEFSPEIYSQLDSVKSIVEMITRLKSES